MRFWKYEGLGNDFILIDQRGISASSPLLGPTIDADWAIGLCDRHFGIGADGVLWLDSSHRGGVARMTVINADGSTAEMCGNGLRCVARYLGGSPAPGEAARQLDVETGAGVLSCVLHTHAVDVCLGPVTDGGVGTLEVDGQRLLGRHLNLGNPHFVLRAPAARAEALRFGPHLQPGGVVPKGVNLSCRQFTGPTSLELHVYERGAGLTLACGTGAAATVASAWLDGDVAVGTPVDVRLPGGDLTLFGGLDALWLRGPARAVFQGEL